MWSASESFAPSAAEGSRTVNTKVVKSFGNLDLGLEIEVGVGELLALSQCALCTGKLALFSSANSKTSVGASAHPITLEIGVMTYR